MDIDAVRNTLEQASLASLAMGLAIGFFFSSKPVALAAIPVSLAYVTRTHAPQGAVLLVSIPAGHDRDACAPRACRRSRRRLGPALHRSRMGVVLGPAQS